MTQEDVRSSSDHARELSPLSTSTNFGQDLMDSIEAISQPVELVNLPVGRSAPTTRAIPSTVSEQNLQSSAASQRDGVHSQGSELKEQNIDPAKSGQEESAIGPPTDKLTSVRTPSSASPQLIITLLLHSTDTRHPYTINEKYLDRRGIAVEDSDPVNMSVYTLKELIWRDWRPEWETRPVNPASVRLIHMGRMLDDKAYLRDCRFSSGETPHVVHMTIKPQEVVDDEDARMAKGPRGEREASERTAGCRCMVM